VGAAISDGLFIIIVLGGSYLIGSIPFAYIIVRLATGEDITLHGTGNVGAMNVRRSTGSWWWFVVAMVADALKGIVPVLAIRSYADLGLLTPAGSFLGSGAALAAIACMTAVAGAVLGHNYSLWMAIVKRGFHRTGKGLATGGGALLAYDWRYFVVAVAVGLATIAITRYMMAGQVAASLALPTAALVLQSPDWPFALMMGLVVYSAHHKRFVGMLQGHEPKLYVNDRMGPRG